MENYTYLKSSLLHCMYLRRSSARCLKSPEEVSLSFYKFIYLQYVPRNYYTTVGYRRKHLLSEEEKS